jgi:hypothetical protein
MLQPPARNRHQDTPSILRVSKAADILSLHDSFRFPASSICVNLLSMTRRRVPVMDGVTTVSFSLASR